MVVTYWFVSVNGKGWHRRPLTWEDAEKLRTRLRTYYPKAAITLDSITTHADKEQLECEA